MIELVWLDTLSGGTVQPGRAWAWLGRTDVSDAQAALGAVRASRRDMADAALAKEEAGAGRLLRRRLLRALAARVLDVSPDAVEIGRTDDGAPFVAAPRRLEASVAGAGDWAVLAVSEAPVGADVETFDAAEPDEVRRLLDWTAREAAVKALGRGWRGASPEAVSLQLQTDGGWSGRCGGQPVVGQWRCGTDWAASVAVLAPGEGGHSHPSSLSRPS